VSDIGRERIRRVINTINNNDENKLDLFKDNDLGFKCYTLGNSNFSEWADYEGNDTDQIEKLFDSFETPLKNGWKPNDLITEIMLIEGFPLDSELREVSNYYKNNIIIVQSNLLEYRLFICLDKKIDNKTIEELSLDGNDVFVCIENALSDQAKIRLDDIGNIHVI
jgi:adenine-specific DNA-methyltransferase